MNIIDSNIDSISALCRSHNVNSLFVFGSVLTDRFNSDSDVDMLVSFKDISAYDYADNYLNLKESLSLLLRREIDLIEDAGIHNAVLRRNIDNTKKQIYG